MTGRRLARLRRVTLEPVLVRAGVYLAGLGALLLAAPAPLLSQRLVLAGAALLAVLPALAPGSRWVTAVALVAAAGWMTATSGYGEPVTLVRVLALAGVLYVWHSLAALAAALPLDAVVASDALARWLAWALAVVAVSSLLSVALLAGMAEVAAGGSYLAATLAGLAVAVGVSALLSWAARH